MTEISWFHLHPSTVHTNPVTTSSLQGRAKEAHAYRRRATAPKTAARPAPAPVAALMAPALKAGWEAAGVETAVPVAPAEEGTRGVEETEETEETGVVGRGVEEELEKGC